MPRVQTITPNLWFDKQAEEAVNFYVAVFPNSRVGRKSRYGKEGFEIHGMPEGTTLTVEFELDGQTFVALNGGPHFQFSEAISFIIHCKDQAEVDRYWTKLSAGGDPAAQQCGWLKDKYGVSWQVVPTVLTDMMVDKDRRRFDRVMKVMLQMKKLEIAALQRAYDGV